MQIQAIAEIRKKFTANSVLFGCNHTVHNINQIMSVTPENDIFELSTLKAGGVGVVGKELPVALNEHGKMDVRNFGFYHAPNNEQGGIKVLVAPKELNINKLDEIKTLPASNFLSFPAGTSIKEIASGLATDENRIRYVLMNPPDTKGNCKFIRLEPTDVSGVIKRISEKTIAELKTIPYYVYKHINHNNPQIPISYFLHTPDLAKADKPYTYTVHGGSNFMDLYYSDANRALVDALPKFANGAEQFNPAAILNHCRPTYCTNVFAAEASQTNPFLRGLMFANIAHNYGPDYQGRTENPFEFAKYVMTQDDWNILTKHKNFPKLAGIEQKWHYASQEEKALAKAVFDPFLKNFIDQNGCYNITMTPISMKKLNPKNSKIVPVSHYNDWENANLNDMTGTHLTKAYNEAERTPVNNGIDISDAGYDKPKYFGDPSAGINKEIAVYNHAKHTSKNKVLPKMWYNMYNPKTDTVDKIVEARRNNKIGLLNKLGEIYERAELSKSRKELDRFFFPKDGWVLGGLKSYKKGDVLFGGWGRGDPQKGLHIAFEGLLKILEDKSIPKEIKLRMKLLIGGKWNDVSAGDYPKIQQAIFKINRLDNGIYEGQACYVNGYASNRLGSCFDFGVFSSRYETCGIAFAEGMKAGAPSLCTRTGVTASIIKNGVNGFVADEPFMLNGLSDDERVAKAAEDYKKMYLQAIEVYDNPDKYAKMCKEAIDTPTEWHLNSASNKPFDKDGRIIEDAPGKTSVQAYKEDVIEYGKPRNTEPLKKLTGEFGQIAEEMPQPAIPKERNIIQETTNIINENTTVLKKTKWGRIAFGIGAGAAAAGIYIYLKNKKKTVSKIAAPAGLPQTKNFLK
ncbi:MAG: glycosyltransferase [Heliobacteriaceae bacterium]|nr:glycosyltransferase [Heliobacteriaceae bacterium]